MGQANYYKILSFSGRIIYFLGEYSIMEEELDLFVEPIWLRGVMR
jgi:hypothetical protein